MTSEACEKMRFLPAEAVDIPDVLALYREGDYYEGIRREKALEKSGEDTK